MYASLLFAIISQSAHELKYSQLLFIFINVHNHPSPLLFIIIIHHYYSSLLFIII